jgi:hypothetical protein
MWMLLGYRTDFFAAFLEEPEKQQICVVYAAARM